MKERPPDSSETRSLLVDPLLKAVRNVTAISGNPLRSYIQRIWAWLKEECTCAEQPMRSI